MKDYQEWVIAGIVVQVRPLPNGEFEVTRPPSTEKFIYSKEILESVGEKYVDEDNSTD